VIGLAIKKLKPAVDLVLFGKQAIDGDTAQVGPGVSEFLKMPLVTYVKTLTIEDGRFTVETMMDNGVDVLDGPLPAVMTVVKEAAAPRFATLGGWMEAKHAKIPCWGVKQLKATPDLCGLKGSPTKVVKIFAPPVKSGGTKMDGREQPSAAVEAIIQILQQKGMTS
jgi:electron transfer flavoprotein beta subunit